MLSIQSTYARFDRVTIEGGFGSNVATGAAVNVTGPDPSQLRFIQCTFRRNRADLGGAAVATQTTNSSLRFFECLFDDNRVGSLGGGIYAQNPQSVVVERCEFRGNSAGGGGAICAAFGATVMVKDSVITDNEARGPLGGGAICTYQGGDVQVASSTIFGNRSLSTEVGGIAVGPGELSVNNSILWANAGSSGATAAVNQLSPLTGVTYSHVQGWTLGGTGNSSDDPMLTDPLGGDFGPLPGSPVIDAGGPENQLFWSVGDFLGKRRRVDDPQTPDTGAGPGAVIDIGAVERSVGAIGTVFCSGDRNGSGQRGVIDAFGSTRASDNSVVLVASQLPTQQFGIFFLSRDLGQGVTPTGLTICLGGHIERLIGPGQVLNSGSNGQFSLALDLTAIPDGPGLTSVLPGQSWSFQCWHRDPSGFNGFYFTDSTTIVFE